MVISKLVVGDYFSKWLELIPLSDMTAAHVASRFVEIVVSRFGVPYTFHTDQGSNFESKLTKALRKLLGINKTHTTYHPQSNRMVERANKTIQVAPRSYVDRDYSSWDIHMPLVQLAYNTSVHCATGCTPHFVFFLAGGYIAARSYLRTICCRVAYKTCQQFSVDS